MSDSKATNRRRDLLVTGVFVVGIAITLLSRMQTDAWGGSTQRIANIVHTLDPNVASAEQLTIISGIGPAKAKAIVDYRNEYQSEHGLNTTAYQRAEDLQKVHGIGPKTVEKLRAWLHFPSPQAD